MKTKPKFREIKLKSSKMVNGVFTQIYQAYDRKGDVYAIKKCKIDGKWETVVENVTAKIPALNMFHD